MKKYKDIISFILIVGFTIYYGIYKIIDKDSYASVFSYENISIEDIPDYNGNDTIVINENEPFFTDEDKQKSTFEEYSELDELGRCGSAFALVSKETMPSEKRTSIGMIKPTGWHISKYDFIDQKYLYNRCHLIAYALTGENANEKNLITCTRYTNTQIMLDYETDVLNYIKSTNNHVLYRVTPIFEEDNLLAKGVLMEAYSVEDDGEGIKFNIFAYNIQPNVKINYKTGDNELIEN